MLLDWGQYNTIWEWIIWIESDLELFQVQFHHFNHSLEKSLKSTNRPEKELGTWLNWYCCVNVFLYVIYPKPDPPLSTLLCWQDPISTCIFIKCSSQYFHQTFVSWHFEIFNTFQYFQLLSQYFDEVFISLYFQREINVYLEWKFSDGRNFYRADYRISNVRGHFFISKSS